MLETDLLRLAKEDLPAYQRAVHRVYPDLDGDVVDEPVVFQEGAYYRYWETKGVRAWNLRLPGLRGVRRSRVTSESGKGATIPRIYLFDRNLQVLERIPPEEKWFCTLYEIADYHSVRRTSICISGDAPTAPQAVNRFLQEMDWHLPKGFILEGDPTVYYP